MTPAQECASVYILGQGCPIFNGTVGYIKTFHFQHYSALSVNMLYSY